MGQGLDKGNDSCYTCIMAQICNQTAPACCAQIAALLEPRFFKALCDPTRIALLARMAQWPGASTVTQIAECCPVDLSVVSRHLSVLREAGIVTARKQGKEVWYRVRYRELASTLRTIADAIEQCCPKETFDEQHNDSLAG